jgi:hypothetical protein
MKRTNFLLTNLLLMLILSIGTAKAMNAREIAQKSYDAISLESMEMNATLKIFDAKGHVRIRKVNDATRKFGETVKTKLTFLSPADVAGTSMLIYDYENKDDDMWVYLPSMRNTRRIVSSEKGNSFMGSEFSNADMTKPNLDDYTYTLAGSKEVAGKDCWMVESVCKTENIADISGFSRKIAYIDKATFLAQRMDYYDFDDELFKVMTLKDYRKLSNGGYFACYMEMKQLKKNRRSEMLVDQLKTGSKLTESSFSTLNLGK